MNVLIVGAGKSGVYLAEKLRGAHKVTMIESRPERADYVAARMPDVRVVRGDGCEPARARPAGAAQADLVAALTGDDEDNLVVSFLCQDDAPGADGLRAHEPPQERVDVHQDVGRRRGRLDRPGHLQPHREGSQPRRRHHAHGALRREHGHRRDHAARRCAGRRQDALRTRHPQVRARHGDHLGRRSGRAARGYDAQARATRS